MTPKIGRRVFKENSFILFLIPNFSLFCKNLRKKIKRRKDKKREKRIKKEEKNVCEREQKKEEFGRKLKKL